MSTLLSSATLSHVRACVLCTGVVIASAGMAAAQEPPAQPQQPQPQQQQQPPQQPATPQGVVFTLDGGLMFWQVKPDKTADFEAVVAKVKEALQKTTDETRKAQANGWRIYRAQEPAPGGNVFYIFVIDPAAKGADYSSAAMLKLLYDTFPTEAQDLYKKLTESVAGGRNVLNLQLVANMGQP